MVKPFSPKELMMRVSYRLNAYAARRPIRRMNTARFEGLFI